MSKASRLVSSAVLLEDSANVTIAGKEYNIPAPTIHRIAGAAKWLADVEGGTDFEAFIGQMKNITSACKALSYFINDNEDLADELMQGTLHEVCVALASAIKLLSVQDFSILSTSARSVARLAANPRP